MTLLPVLFTPQQVSDLQQPPGIPSYEQLNKYEIRNKSECQMTKTQNLFRILEDLDFDIIS